MRDAVSVVEQRLQDFTHPDWNSNCAFNVATAAVSVLREADREAILVLYDRTSDGNPVRPSVINYTLDRVCDALGIARPER